ncbi:MAG: alpha/beta hydrolase [Anaerolineaceae bacterium]|nr:alpha/beta hydrolase [Anaerolineaceae bacterium]
MSLSPNNTNWLIEERLALVPEIGKFVRASLPKPDLVEERVQYGEHPNQYNLLFWPENPELRRLTSMFFLHGGGWSSGSPALYRFIGHFFARLGYPTILGGYRLAPEFQYPVQLDDVYASLTAGLSVLHSLGLGAQRVIAGGISAGGHLASLLVYDRDAAGRNLLAGDLFAGVLSISGPLSFATCTNPSLLEMIDDFVGSQANSDRADAIQSIRGDERIPALLIHGDRDPLVDMENSLAFASRLAHSGTCPVEMHLAHGWHHADLAAMFLRKLPETQILKDWLANLGEKVNHEVKKDTERGSVD